MTQTILLLGATGNTALQMILPLKAKGHLVRALVRDRNKADRLRQEGAEIFVGDMLNLASLKEAFTGATAVYLCTPPTSRALDMVQVVLKAAETFGRPHVVSLSVIGASNSGPNDNSRLHAQADELLQRSGLPYTILRPSFFMDDFFLSTKSIATESKLVWPVGDGKVGLVDTRDIVDVAVLALSEPSAHAGKTYTLTGPKSISFAEVARIISTQLGSEIKYVNMEPDKWTLLAKQLGLDEWFAKNLTQYCIAFSKNAADVTTDDVKMVTGHTARSFETFCTEKLIPAIRQHTQGQPSQGSNVADKVAATSKQQMPAQVQRGQADVDSLPRQ
jgi:uncharacterized protein YbjT (DUF2867 family)